MDKDDALPLAGIRILDLSRARGGRGRMAAHPARPGHL